MFLFVVVFLLLCFCFTVLLCFTGHSGRKRPASYARIGFAGHSGGRKRPRKRPASAGNYPSPLKRQAPAGSDNTPPNKKYRLKKSARTSVQREEIQLRKALLEVQTPYTDEEVHVGPPNRHVPQ